MIKPSMALANAIAAGERTATVARVYWPRDAGTSPLILSDQPIPATLLEYLRWEGKADLEAGAFSNTTMGADIDDDSFVGLLVNGWTASTQIADQTRAWSSGMQYSPIVGRYPGGGRYFVMYYDGTLQSDVKVSTSTDGETWGAGIAIGGAAYPHLVRSLCCETQTGRILYLMDLGASNMHILSWASSGGGWIATSDTDEFGAGFTPYAMWQGPGGSGGDIHAVGYEGGAWKTKIMSRLGTWGASVATTITPGAPYAGVIPLAGCSSGRRNLLLVVATDGGANNAIQLHASWGIGAWTLVHEYGAWPFGTYRDADIGRLFCHTDGSIYIGVTGTHATFAQDFTYEDIIAEDDESLCAANMSLRYTLPAAAWCPSFQALDSGYIICSEMYAANYVPNVFTAYFTKPTYGSGTWTSAVKDSNETAPAWNRVAMGAQYVAGDSDVAMEFRAASTPGGVAAATWRPAAGGWRNSDKPSALEQSRYVQSRASLSSSVAGAAPRFYRAGLTRESPLQDLTVLDWGSFTIEMGDVHARQQYGSIKLMIGPAQASYWPWETARIQIGRVPLNGRIEDAAWICSANVHRVSVQGDVMTLTLGEGSE